MANRDDRHLSEDDLLRYADGEVAGEQVWMARHLLACWACRGRLSDLEATIKAIVQFRNDAYLPAIPTPPKPWENLHARLRSHSTTPRTPSLWARFLSGPMSNFHRHRFSTALVLGAVGLFGGLWLLRPAEASASSILANARTAEDRARAGIANNLIHQRLQIRRKRNGDPDDTLVEYAIWQGQAHFRLTTAEAGRPVLRDIEEVYRDNQLNWQEPLSATAYSAWRSRQRIGEESVDPRTQPGRVTVTTIRRDRRASAANIEKAEITFRTTDYHPIQERFWTSSGNYEITETHWDVVPSEAASSNSTSTESNLSFAAEPRHGASSLTQKDTDPDATEIQIRHALHHLRADLGEPITVGRGPEGEVIVEVLGVAPERLQQIEGLLHRHPFVVLDRTGGLLQSSEPCDGCATSSALLISGGSPSAVDPKLVEHFGGQAELQSFIRETLGASESAMAHSYALRILARRYDHAAERLLSPGSKSQLWEIITSHTEAINDDASHVHANLRPILHGMFANSEPKTANADLDVSWQQSTFQIFGQVQTVDRLLKAAFTQTNSPLSGSDALSRLATEISVERALLAQYRDFVERKSTLK